jgi:hypothetical protein
MTVKRMLLLASMAVAALGLAALPALTGASGTERWWKDDQQPENTYPLTASEKQVKPKGELSITQGGKKFGPCVEYEFQGKIWNEIGGMGEGTLQTVTGPKKNCVTSIGGCTILESTTEGLPWSLTLTAAKLVKFSGIKIQLHLSPGCPAPLTVTATGAVEGQLVEATETTGSEVVFNNSGGLTMNAAAATLDGRLEFGTRLTAPLEP